MSLSEGAWPILEHDPSREALIEPGKVIKPVRVAEHCVVCFFREIIEQYCGGGKATRVADHRWENATHPLYEMDFRGKRLAVFHPGVGAPLAVGLMEEVIARGVRKVIVCGGAGALQPDITIGHIVVPTSAVRDEGTSYHYLPPSREVAPSPEGVAAIESVLRAHNLPYALAKTWTTDAPYRETPAKIARRRAEGCATVEMEAAALFALAQFRSISLAQMLYGGDDVSGTEWDHRGWHSRRDVREQMFLLAAEAVLTL